MKMRLLLAAMLLIAGNAFAQGWPTKPVRVIVTFAPGGSSDIVARLIAVPLQTELGQTILVDNKPGAGGTIGALEAARAAPDGYTLLLSNSSPISISPAMQDEPRYDPVKSFSHVAYIGSVANVFVIHPSVPAKTLPELVAWIRAEPNPVNYGSGGIGSIGHIVGETLKKDQNLQMEHVGYKGSAPMHNDLLPGTIKLSIDTLPQNVPFMKDGRLRAIAVTSPTRAAMARGIGAAGMKIELYARDGRVIAAGVTNAKGLLEDQSNLSAGSYEAVFHVAEWYRQQDVPLPDVPFLDIVHFRFGISDPRQH